MQESFHGYGGKNGILVRGRNVKTHTPQKSNELIPKIAMFKGSYLFQGPSFGVAVSFRECIFTHSFSVVHQHKKLVINGSNPSESRQRRQCDNVDIFRGLVTLPETNSERALKIGQKPSKRKGKRIPSTWKTSEH